MTLTPGDSAKNWFESVWNQGRRETIAEMLAPEVVFHDGGTTSIGVQPFQQFFDRMQATFSKIHIDVEDTLVDGDKVCVRWTCKALHTGEGFGVPPTGIEIHVTGISVICVVNAKFVEAWQNWDMLALMDQISGHGNPPPYVTPLA